MKTKLAFAITVAAAAFASAAFAGDVVGPGPVGAPAPLLGAGLPGLAILAAAGGGYIAMRLRRRGRD
ncbi:MAG: hypothetical protein ACXWKV_16665 [Caulobacteraceae bacterium]